MSKMNTEEYLTYLPSEIIINILSRLPVRIIISCKCVCKSWLNLLNSPEFSKTHLSNSILGLVVYSSMLFKFFEFVDSLDNLESHEFHYNPVTEFDRRAIICLNRAAIRLQGSASGLLFFREISQPDLLYICNPITWDYIQLPSHGGKSSQYPSVVTYGFGVSKMSGQHKLVRIFHDFVSGPKIHLQSIPKFVCQSYTLGTGSWRIIAPGGAPLRYNDRSIAACVNGNLHWFVRDLQFYCWISCFDLQTELFSTFSPPKLLQRGGIFHRSLAVLGDCLCLCDITSGDELVIWLMKEYRVEKSWTKEYVISKGPNFKGGPYDAVYPIKVFKDGDILLAWKEKELWYYSNTTRAISKIDMFERDRGYIHQTFHIHCGNQALPYTPNFLSLKSFTMEDASHSDL